MTTGDWERLLLAARGYGLSWNVSTLEGEGPMLVKQAPAIAAQRRVWTVVTIGHADHAVRKTRAQPPASARKPFTNFARWGR